MTTDIILLVLTLVASGVACAAAAISAFFARKNNVASLRSDVADLLDAVDKVARDTRSAKMQRVRQAREDAAVSPPPEYRPNEVIPADPKQIKAALRQKALVLKH